MTGISEPAAPRTGIGGWLLLLCRLLIVFHPLSLAVTASSAFNALLVRGAPVAIVLIIRLAVVAFGVAAAVGEGAAVVAQAGRAALRAEHDRERLDHQAGAGGKAPEHAEADRAGEPVREVRADGRSDADERAREVFAGDDEVAYAGVRVRGIAFVV